MGAPNVLWVLEQVVSGRLSDIPDSSLVAAADAAGNLELPYTRQILNVECRRRNAVAAGDPDAESWRIAPPVIVGIEELRPRPDTLWVLTLACRDQSLLAAASLGVLSSALSELWHVCGRVEMELARRREVVGA